MLKKKELMILFKENKNVILYNKIAKINTHIYNNIFLKRIGGPLPPLIQW